MKVNGEEIEGAKCRLRGNWDVKQVRLVMAVLNMCVALRQSLN